MLCYTCGGGGGGTAGVTVDVLQLDDPRVVVACALDVVVISGARQSVPDARRHVDDEH